MNSGWNSSGISFSDVGSTILLIGVIVFVLPKVVDVLALLSQGFTGNGDEAMNLLLSLLQPWWLGFALSASTLFVLFGMFLKMIGAVELLEM